MNLGGNISPWRIPCGGTGVEIYYLGAPWQHYRVADSAIARFTFNATVAAGAGCAAPFNPCELYTQGGNPVTGDGPGCEGHKPAPGPFGGWIGAGLNQYSLAAGQINTIPESWHAAGDTVNFAVCHKTGFKNVAVRRQWHGIFGFTEVDGCATVVEDCGLVEGSGLVHSWNYYGLYVSSPPQTKYLGISVLAVYIGGVSSIDTGNFLNTAGDSLWDHGGTPMLTTTTWQRTVYVDGNSGEQTLSGSQTGTINTSLHHTYDGTEICPPAAILQGDAAAIVNWLCGINAGCLDGNWATTLAASYRSAVLGLEAGEVSVSWSEDGHGNFSFSTPPASGQIGTQATCAVAITATTAHVLYTRNVFQPEGGDGSTGGWQFASSVEVTVSLGSPWTAQNVYDDAKALAAAWPLNDDRLYPWRQDGQQQVAPLMSRNEHPGNVTPNVSLPLKVNDLRAPTTDSNGNAPFTTGAGNNGGAITDANGNLAHSKATDCGQLPSVAPVDWIPTYDMVTPADWVPTYTQMDYFDDSCHAWRWKPGYEGIWASDLIRLIDGRVLGAPKPAGYQDSFDFNFTDWKGCHFDNGDGVVGFTWYTFGYGMTAARYNGNLPRNATQWTNSFECINKPPGASIMYHDLTSVSQHDYGHSSGLALADNYDALWLYKYAEIKDRWPSQNFARPGGQDKFAYDETMVACAAVVSDPAPGGVVTFSGAVTFGLAGIWGGRCVNGFYHLTAIDSGSATLGSKVYDLPSDWKSRSDDDDTCFGKLRFPDAPSLLGRSAITTSGRTATFTTAQPSFGLASGANTESVDLYDAAMNLLAANVTATRTADTTFTTSASYPTAVWVMIHGAPAYQVCDNYAKGDYLALAWLFDNRTNGEVDRTTGILNCAGSQIGQPTQNNGYASFTQTAACLPFKPCCPAVVCFSPNGETWPNGVTYPFPASFVMDEKYGSKQQYYFQPTMTDLFWQPPHHPCGATDPLTGDPIDADHIIWKMDDGTCQMDSSDIDTGVLTKYYPHSPQVEARSSVPAGFPALPGGFQIGWLSPVDHTGDGVAYPPGFIGFESGGSPSSAATPYSLHSLFCAAIADGSTCRFKVEYLDQFPSC